MNRLLALMVGVASVALVAFGVIVFTSEPPVSVRSAQPGQQVSALAEVEAPAGRSDPAIAPASPTETSQETAQASKRFAAWAKQLRDAGLTVTAGRVTEAGDTISVARLVIAGPAETPGWRWTAERAALYDLELFHLQAAGAMEFSVITGPGQEITWSGRADAIGVAMQRDKRDALSSSVVARINGLSLAQQGAQVPLTLGDGQLRILLKGGTGLLAPGANLALNLKDLTVPWAAGSALGSTFKSFTAGLAIDRPITRYSLQQVIAFFTRGNAADVNLGTIAADWGALHFTGKGAFGLGPSGAPRARFEVKVSDALALLDAVSAAGGASSDLLAAEYAALLLEMGREPEQPAVPMVISLKDGAIVLEGRTGDIRLAAPPQPRDGT